MFDDLVNGFGDGVLWIFGFIGGDVDEFGVVKGEYDDDDFGEYFGDVVR